MRRTARGEWNRFCGTADEGLGARTRRAPRNFVVADRRLRHLGRHSGHRAQSQRFGRPAIPQARRTAASLGRDFKSKAGLPVINIPGCPAHPDWITQIVVAVATGRGGDIGPRRLQRPKTFFTSFTQTGCTRNMHFAYKVSATEFRPAQRLSRSTISAAADR